MAPSSPPRPGAVSGPVRRIDAIEAPEEPGPHQRSPAATGSGCRHDLGVRGLDDLLGNRNQFPSARLRTYLDRAGCFQVVHRDERFGEDRKSTRLNYSHANISYAVFCLKKKTK